jgi:hypothetical protein
MRRWVFRLATTSSLLLCLAVVVMWVRGYPTKTEVQFWVRSSPVVHLESASGRVLLDVSENALPNPRSSFEWSDSDNRFHSGREREVPRELVGTRRPPRTLWQSGAKQAGPFEYGRDRDSWDLVAPHWFIVPHMRLQPDRQHQRRVPRVRVLYLDVPRHLIRSSLPLGFESRRVGRSSGTESGIMRPHDQRGR